VDPAHPSPARLYRTVRLIRRFEERAIELVRSGEIVGGIHPCIGQEAVAAGVCAALRPDDIILTNHRGHGHVLAKGTPPHRLLAELAGRITGVAGGRGGSLHPSDYANGAYGTTITVGHGAAIGTGVAWVAGNDGSGRVVATFFGDGAVSQGALLEAMNMAALWRVPQVFVCENNTYATTQHIADSLAGTITGRAAAFGIPAVTVDGMDPATVYEATAHAVARARAGAGPTLLECATYRFDAHHTFEYAARPRYRTAEEVERWRERDPMSTVGDRLTPDVRSAIDAEVEVLMDEAVEFARTSAKPDRLDAMAHVYATPIPTRAGVAG
jgi:pyruvate dehydrogenase E1 component alpha subunit